MQMFGGSALELIRGRSLFPERGLFDTNASFREAIVKYDGTSDIFYGVADCEIACFRSIFYCDLALCFGAL